MKRDVKVGLFVIFVSLLFLIGTETLEPLQLASDPGPKLFPRITYMGLLISGIGIVVFSKKEDVTKIILNKRVLVMTLMILLYTISLQYLGYFISTLWFGFCSCWFLSDSKRNRLLPAALTTLITTITIYVLFKEVFEILLPKGVFNIFE